MNTFQKLIHHHYYHHHYHYYTNNNHFSVMVTPLCRHHHRRRRYFVHQLQLQQHHHHQHQQQQQRSIFVTASSSSSYFLHNQQQYQQFQYQQYQQKRLWYDNIPNPIHVQQQQEEYMESLHLQPDEVDIRLAEIANDTTSTQQSIWIQFFLDGHLIDGTQISIPKHQPTIDHIKYATYDQCYHLCASNNIAPISLKVLPTQHKRRKKNNKKHIKKLTRKNRYLSADTIYDMRIHGGESCIAGVIVKAHTKRYIPNVHGERHYRYGERVAIDLGIEYITSILQNYTSIPIQQPVQQQQQQLLLRNSSSSSSSNNVVQVLYNVPDLETGGQFRTNIVLRPISSVSSSSVSSSTSSTATGYNNTTTTNNNNHNRNKDRNTTTTTTTTKNTNSTNETTTTVEFLFWNQVYNIAEYGTILPPPPPPPPSHNQATRTTMPSTATSIDHENDNNNNNIHDEESLISIQPQYRICITGTNGIGLTTTTAILIRQLLQQGKTVVYHIVRTATTNNGTTGGWIYEFVPHNDNLITKSVMDHTVSDILSLSNNNNNDNTTTTTALYQHVDVKVIAEDEFCIAKTPSLVNDDSYQNSYYIVDYGNNNSTNNTIQQQQLPDHTTRCRIIVIASQNIYQSIKSTINNYFLYCKSGQLSGTILYYPMWTLSDILLLTRCRSLIPSTLSTSSLSLSHNNTVSEERHITERYHQVGGIPGCIFTLPYTYHNILQEQYNAISTLCEQQLSYIMKHNNWSLLLNTSIPLVGYNYNYNTSTIHSETRKMYGNNNDLPFMIANIGPISKHIQQSIYLYHQEFFWNQLQHQQQSTNTPMYNTFGRNFMKVLFHSIMMKDNQSLACKDLNDVIYYDSSKSNTTSIATTGIKPISFGKLDEAMEIVSYSNENDDTINTKLLIAAMNQENVLFYSTSTIPDNHYHHMQGLLLSSSQPPPKQRDNNKNDESKCIDFVYRDNDTYHIFHTTMERSIQKEQCENMIDTIMKNLDDIIIVHHHNNSKKGEGGGGREMKQRPKQQNTTTSNIKIQLYFVVPSFHFDTFTILVPNQYNHDDATAATVTANPSDDAMTMTTIATTTRNEKRCSFGVLIVKVDLPSSSYQIMDLLQ